VVVGGVPGGPLHGDLDGVRISAMPMEEVNGWRER